MPIVVQHQAAPGAVGMAAYATGGGSAKGGLRKEMLALYAQRQEMLGRRKMHLEQLGAQVGMQQRGFAHAARMQEGRLEADWNTRQEEADRADVRQQRVFDQSTAMQEAEIKAREDAADLADRRQAADMGRERPDPMLSDYELSPEQQRELDAIRNSEMEIRKSRHLSGEDRQAALHYLRKRKYYLQARAAKKPTLQARIAKRTENLPGWQRELPWNVDEDGNLSLAGGARMPDSPLEIQRQQEQDQATADHEELIAQWKFGDVEWLRRNKQRGESYKYYQELDENANSTRAEIEALVDADVGPLGPRPPRPPRPGTGGLQGQRMGGRRVGGESQGAEQGGGNETDYDPATDTFTPSAGSQQPGAVGALNDERGEAARWREEALQRALARQRGQAPQRDALAGWRARQREETVPDGAVDQGGGNETDYDPATDASTPSAGSQQPGAVGALNYERREQARQREAARQRLPDGAVDQGDGTYVYFGERRKYKSGPQSVAREFRDIRTMDEIEEYLAPQGVPSGPRPRPSMDEISEYLAQLDAREKARAGFYGSPEEREAEATRRFGPLPLSPF